MMYFVDELDQKTEGWKAKIFVELKNGYKGTMDHYRMKVLSQPQMTQAQQEFSPLQCLLTWLSANGR